MQSSIHASLKRQDGGTPVSKWTGLCIFSLYLEFTALQWIPVLLLTHVSTSTLLCLCLWYEHHNSFCIFGVASVWVLTELPAAGMSSSWNHSYYPSHQRPWHETVQRRLWTFVEHCGDVYSDLMHMICLLSWYWIWNLLWNCLAYDQWSVTCPHTATWLHCGHWSMPPVITRSSLKSLTQEDTMMNDTFKLSYLQALSDDAIVKRLQEVLLGGFKQMLDTMSAQIIATLKDEIRQRDVTILNLKKRNKVPTGKIRWYGALDQARFDAYTWHSYSHWGLPWWQTADALQHEAEDEATDPTGRNWGGP